jgi:hypothetical protein
LKTGEPNSRVRSTEIISGSLRKFQKLLSDDCTNCVNTYVTGSGIATAISVEASHRVKAAFFKFCS